MKRRSLAVLVALAAALSTGCVPDDSEPTPMAFPNGQVGNNASNGNTVPNNASNGNTAPNNSDSNNMAPNNGAPNANSNNSTPVAVPGWIGGTSVDGRPIVVEHYGDSGPVLFILSAIHGTERLAVTYGERFRTELAAGYARRNGIQVVYLQSANPDGVSRYQRYNTNDVDLNRNFDTANFEGGGVGGDSPLSEPEARAIKGIVDASGLTAAISLHCCVPIFDHDGPGFELATAMSLAMDERFRFEEGKLGASPGSLGSYVGLDLGLPIITAEFARTENMAARPQLEQMDFAMEAAGDWVRDNPSDGVLDFDAFPNPDGHDFEAWFAGASQSGLPLRQERVGPTGSGDAPNVLISGLDGRHRRGTWIAEHTRRELLAFPGALEQTWLIQTVAHPDAVADGSIDASLVRDAVAGGDATTAEAAAVLDLLTEPSRVFLIDNATNAEDCIEIFGAQNVPVSGSIPARFQCDPQSDNLATALADAGHTVVRFTVETETLEAQLSGTGTNTTFDTTLPSPVDYSDVIFELAGIN